MNKISKGHNQILNYLVPTPLVLANGSSSVLSKVRKGGSSPKPTTAAVNSKAHPTVPSEVNVLVIPPPVKWNSSPMTAGEHPAQREQKSECPSPQGVLSYEGLVQLRKTTSMKRAQEASQTPETQDKQLSKPIKHILLDDKSPHAQADQSAERKPSPPAVAPKPKKFPSNIPRPTTSPQTDKTVMNPQKVRMEALYKLGLLKDPESSTSPSPRQPYHSKWVRPHGCPPPPPPPHRSTPSSVPDPPHFKPPTVPATVEPQTGQTHWTNGVVHHRSLSDLTPGPRQLSVKSATGKSATLEHSGLGLGSSLSGQNISVSSYRDAKNNLPQRANTNGVLQNGQPSSSALDTRKHWESGVKGQQRRMVKKRATPKCSRLSHLIYVPKYFFATHCSALESPLLGDSVGVGMGLLACTGRELFTLFISDRFLKF